ARVGEDGPVFDTRTTVCEAAEQPECHLACGIVETERGAPGKVVELRLQELFKDLVGGLVLLHIPATADSPGPVSELIDLGLAECPLERLGHLVHVDDGQLRQSETFGLVDQLGVDNEQFAQ
ncbi:MAG: hypothetical protein ACYCU6_02120, partial [Acidimicrobiales bacterium]